MVVKKSHVFSLISKILVLCALVVLSSILLKSDFFTFIIWWIALFALGFLFMPISSAVFKNFDDKGWMFSKVIAVAVCGYVQWLLSVVKLIPFTSYSCIIVCAVCATINIVLLATNKGKREILPSKKFDLVYLEEIIFFVAFLLWTYMAGFNPAAHGTEKYMDFGFMQAMMKSTTLPAEDMWYSGKAFNYYYGGQYFAVFLTKLTGTKVEITYNLMRTLIAGFAFVFPFCIVRQMISDRMQEDGKRFFGGVSLSGGLLAGGAVSLSGNMHYVIYALIMPLFGKTGYWFPDSTRYVGFDPPVEGDGTIHEFPSYSFVLGDLHAHVVNVFFVLVVIAVLYSWIRNKEAKGLKQPVIYVCGLFLGIFQFANTWDFLIYFVVICGVLFFGNLKRLPVDKFLKESAIEWAAVLGISVLLSLPFSLTFDGGMVKGIGVVTIHTKFYQFLVLWGLPFIVCGTFMVKYLLGIKGKSFDKFIKESSSVDLFAAFLSLCAMGLVLIPEVVYVRDIYEGNSPRANTMFKLTYQAYIFFGMMMSYAISRFIFAEKKVKEKKTAPSSSHGVTEIKPCKKRIKISAINVFGVVMACVLLSTFGYIGNAAKSWFTGFPNPSEYQTLDATAYLYDEDCVIKPDASAIKWLNENVEGRPVVLEADGTSYEGYNNRVSAMTGLPTVMGWYVHEWLWRNDLEDENERIKDIETIYTSSNKEETLQLIEKYDISYIFIGTQEYQKYNNLNKKILTSLGEVVFEEKNTALLKMNGTDSWISKVITTMIIKVER